MKFFVRQKNRILITDVRLLKGKLKSAKLPSCNLKLLKSVIGNQPASPSASLGGKSEFSAGNIASGAGFTLVELIIYMGLLVVMLLIFTDIFTSIIDNQLSSKNTSNVADDGRYIYSRFIYDVSRAQSVAEPASYGSASASMSLIIDGQSYTYALNNNNLIVTDPNGSYTLNSEGSSISGLLFTKVGTSSAKSTVRLNFTVAGNVTSRGISDQENFQTTAGLR